MADEVFDVGPKLTCEMVARLQGWDDEEFAWTFIGRKTARYRQIGNAFPPPVAKTLGIAVSAALAHATEPRECDMDTEHDRIYRALRNRGEFMTLAQIAKAIKAPLDTADLARRIDSLRRDFHIEVRSDGTGLAYKLKGFKAFVGQEGHARHERFQRERNRIS
ncbi:DNA cytosine methyltransferase [Planobispora longispora]|uniref:DNA cytosine methyltransferase n=1 Tax=Planobispora longispora TaxID=28887 RepID=UPI001EF6718D|nr:DNA cytosine methyltransferase [Planobispora longispora]